MGYVILKERYKRRGCLKLLLRFLYESAPLLFQKINKDKHVFDIYINRDDTNIHLYALVFKNDTQLVYLNNCQTEKPI